MADAESIWFEQLDRALKSRGRELDEVARNIHREMLRVLAERETDVVLAGEPGHRSWVENPHRGDHEHAAREMDRLWDELGAHAGVGPRPR